MADSASPRGSKYDRLLFIAKPCDPVPGNPDAFAACVLPERIAIVMYDPQEATLCALLNEARTKLGDAKVRSVGLMLPTINRDSNQDGNALWICGKRDEHDLSVGGVLSEQSLRGDNAEVKDFVKSVAAMTETWGRIHILSPFILPRGQGLCQALRDLSGLSVAAGRGPTYKNRFVLSAEDADDTVTCAGLYFSKVYLDRWNNDPEKMPTMTGPVGTRRADKLKHKLKEAYINADNMERVQTIAAVAPFLYTVMVAAFLSIFVQQRCPDTTPSPPPPFAPPLARNATHLPPLPAAAGSATGYHTCTFYENAHNLTPYNEAVLAVNAVTCFVLLAGQYIYAKREWWMIEHLDSDPREPYDALVAQDFKSSFSHLSRALRVINRRATVISFVGMTLLVVNFIMSAVLVLKYYYDGPRTITGLITNTLLVFVQIKNSAAVSFSSWKQEMAISTKAYLPKSFNVVDKDMEQLRIQAELEARGGAPATAPIDEVTVKP